MNKKTPKDINISKLIKTVPINFPKNIDKLIKPDIPINYPDKDNNGKTLDTRNNLKALLDLNKIDVKWNMMLRKREIIIEGISNFIDEKENADLLYVYHLATINGMPNTRLDKHMDSLAWNNIYHPIRESILNKPWDKISRLSNFINTIETKNKDYSYKIIRRWMISAIAAAFSEDGFSSQGVLVLQGEQNIGKTKWVKMLDPIKCGAVKEGVLLDPNNKDTIITASQCWIAELGELDGIFNKADIARIKSYITSSVDILRFPFYPKNSNLCRRTVFVGTVNSTQFLVDDTGNRRWWTIEVEKINFKHGIDIQQVWAEVYDIFSTTDSTTWLLEDELNDINMTNINHSQVDPLEEKLIDFFDWSEGWEERVKLDMSTTQVLEKIGYPRPTKSESTRMGAIIVKMTGTKSLRTRVGRFHQMPLINTKNKNNW